MLQPTDFLKYPSANAQDEKWGLVCTTVGTQNVKPHAPYPVAIHPTDYNFTNNGRVLDEYQLVYITEGEGFFQSSSCEMTRVEAGTILLLFPGERHLYYPNPDTGWNEMWVGFRGAQVDTTIRNFFSRKTPMLKVGVRESIVGLYNKIISYSMDDIRGTQQVIAGVIFHLLGRVYYEQINYTNRGNKNTDKINQAQMLLRENIATKLSPADIAARLSMSYSLLRSLFKTITGVSMSTYQQQLKLNLAKELLTTSSKNISEIACETGFESVSRFCCFFKQHMNITASDFRTRNGILHKTGLHYPEEEEYV
ncbi:MAG: helix-turn-helix domain-containing protein [Alistipes sp.]|nr:helix-turn-helix domain-containing protein [Alistipes sp.]